MACLGSGPAPIRVREQSSLAARTMALRNFHRVIVNSDNTARFSINI